MSLVQDEIVATERWTQERRRQHTHDLLLDAAEEVFAARGFDGASLEEIAETAGYTRGAIYKHFGNKTDLFLALNTRFNERLLQLFEGSVEPGTPLDEIDLIAIAKQWHAAQYQDPKQFASDWSSTCSSSVIPRNANEWLAGVASSHN